MFLSSDPVLLSLHEPSHDVRRELGMAESLFSRLDDTGGTYELDLQYRMNR